MMTPLLSTKIHFPPARPNLVPRPRLIEQLNSGLKIPLTLISAPAGYGKTTLLSEWRAKAGGDYPAAWVSVDSGDNNLFQFWGYVTAALETLEQGLTDSFAPLLQSPHFPSTEVLITALVNSLSSFSKDFILVLDDYHTIRSPEIHQRLTYLVEHLPPRMHLVLLTRFDPPLPLARLRARNQLVELRANDLRFTVAEATVFLNQVMGLALNVKQVETLEQRTEGWIAGLQMAALTMQEREDLENFAAVFTGSHRYIMDYLIEEVLSLQSEKMRDFLLKTSILERMNAALCNTLTGESNSQTVLENLERTNLFVVGLDNERQWYRYHHLFADVLQIHLRRSGPERLLELHRRAAGWLEENGYLQEALHHAFASGDKELAGHLAELNGAQMLARGELVALLAWHEMFSDLVLDRPALCIDKAWALMLTGQVEEVESLLEHVEQLLDDRAPDETVQRLHGNIVAIRCYMASLMGDVGRCLELGQQALEILPVSDSGVRGVVQMAIGGTHILRGDYAAAIQSMREASRLGNLTGNVNLAVTAISSVANLLMAQGQLHLSEETYRQAMKLARLPGGRVLPIAGRAHSGLSRIFYEWNDLPTAQEHAQQTYELGQKWGNADSLVTAHVMLARIFKAHGDLRGAEESLRAAEKLVWTRQLTPSSAEWVEMTRLWLWLAQGNLEACDRWRRANDPSSTDEQPLTAGKRLILLRILLAQGDHATALKGFSQFLRDNEAAGHWGSVIELLVLQSLAWIQKGDLPSALKVLARALALAESEGYMRTFLDEGEPMLNLLRHAVSKGLQAAYARKILAAAAPESIGSQAVQPLIEPLSGRELEVLHLIAAGKSNQEIAAELVVSIGTVKSHLNHIFNKLNVDSRTQCVARARELKLLP